MTIWLLIKFRIKSLFLPKFMEWRRNYYSFLLSLHLGSGVTFVQQEDHSPSFELYNIMLCRDVALPFTCVSANITILLYALYFQ